MSIFISIASYRDPELIRTIRSCIDNAAHPEDLHFSIVLQEFKDNLPNLSWVPNLSLTIIDPKDARGAGYARSIAMEPYNNQTYYLQIDSHMLFEKNWDLMCISEHNKAKDISGNDKIILSYFPPPFYIEPDGSIFFIKNDKKKPPYPTKQKPLLTSKKQWTAQRVEFKNRQMLEPEESSTILAGFVFANGNIVEEVPYDPDISFFGEELCFAMRAWTRGWDIYSPSKVILHHFYIRKEYIKIWDEENIRPVTWQDIEKQSKDKQIKVLCGIEKGTFGAGNIRDLKLFENLIECDFKIMYGLTDLDKSSTIV